MQIASLKGLQSYTGNMPVAQPTQTPLSLQLNRARIKAIASRGLLQNTDLLCVLATNRTFQSWWQEPKRGELWWQRVFQFGCFGFFPCFFSNRSGILNQSRFLTAERQLLQLEAAKPIFMGCSAYETPLQIPEGKILGKCLEEHTFGLVTIYV